MLESALEELQSYIRINLIFVYKRLWNCIYELSNNLGTLIYFFAL